MSVRNLPALLAPRSLAVIGASNRPASVGHALMTNLVHGGFAGSIMPVHPREAHVAGAMAYRGVRDLPTVPDLAVIATPPDSVPAIVADLGAIGTRAAIVLTANFGEGGHDEGLRRRQAVLDAARPHLLRVLGPNCLGLAVPGIGLNATFAREAPLAGRIAFLTQSGGIAVAVLDWARPRGIGFSAVVSMGGMLDVDFGDLLDHYGADPATGSIVLYIEAATHARKFMSAARRAARVKPVIVVKAGRAPQAAKAAASHTGALAGADDVYDAAFRRAGMLRVVEIEELFDAVATLSGLDTPAGNRLAIVTNGGGPGVMATDTLIAAGGSLASLSAATIAALDAVLPVTWSRANPIDIIGDANSRRYEQATAALLRDPGTDAVLIAHCPTAIVSPGEAAAGVIRAIDGNCATSGPRKAVLTSWLGEATAREGRERLVAAGVAHYDTPERAVRAFMHMIAYRDNQALLMETPAAHAAGKPADQAAVHRIIGRALDAGRPWLNALDAAQALAAYGIATPRAEIAGSVDEAGDIAARFAAPVALKIHAAAIVHKSDVGGVALNLNGRDAVCAAAQAMLDRVDRAVPGTPVEGFLVQEMVSRPHAIELIAGIAVDPTFGPVVLFGGGGTAVEVLRDRSLELPPLNDVLARRLIARTRVAKLLAGYRDRPGCDIGALADVLVRLAELAADHAEIVELDINPLLADAQGALALDARIRIERAALRGADRLAICPYPKELEGMLSLRDGEQLPLRPIRPEDEPALLRLIERTSPEDRRFRFFHPIRTLSHRSAAALCQIDYDREMALVVEADDGLAAVARFHADPDRVTAEFAILVRSDLKRRGIGSALMQALIGVARQRGIGTLEGDVLKDNHAMRGLCGALQLRAVPHPDDSSLVRIRAPLCSLP
ncbi:MAG: bifunctional acetate--CoA ligase family protein/GNAT family N-acetyltransferase [Alphaproteobacteria bacterium]|nr:bifunctional acetate--CoA ligase family protein/GNAT family N-acetyltransferase [Alphaproteobacteria bacterium]MCW5740474.1 bifunctional acetate--CoA ligase family protein/GNAT family N-acetyltransferase [Alphaproteobacteria bacterium]